MEYRIVALGVDRVEEGFLLSGHNAENMLPVMERIFNNMLEAESALFHSQGRRGGGSWKGLQPSTIKKKGSAIILFDTGALEKSLTEPDAEYQIKEITNNRVILGTNRPASGYHMTGTKNMPRRPFLRFAPYDRARWVRWIAQRLAEPFAHG